jgi:hypothetical protein
MANQRRTLGFVRYAGIALVCVAAAFGAAFLLRRAVDHGGPVQRGTVAADTRTAPLGSSPTAAGHAEDAVAVHHRSGAPRLASEFAPGVQRITRKRPKPKPSHKSHRTVSHSSGATAPTDTTSTPTYTTSTPTYTPTTTESSPTTGSSGSGGGTTHKSSGSGTGTTSIGGPGKGSGTTTIG